ncbi:MAG: IlvD/Edd family dehydratase [Acidobacteriaceae bacterium]
MRYRSEEWFDGRDELGLQHRSALRMIGIDAEKFLGRPIIGIANSWSELNNCNITLRDVAQAVKRGVLAAGGLPLEFPTISLGEEFMKPTAMLYRNLMAMDVEETLRANPIDGVVLLSNCDKTGPAQLMGAASAGLPAIQVNGGPRIAGKFRGSEIGSGTDLWKYWDEYRTGKLSTQEWRQLEACMSCSVGACNVMGTASTMAALAEALGMMLPGTSTLAATDEGRMVAAEDTGRRIVELVEKNIRPADIMTAAAFDNAIRLCMAIGGSTNAILHLTAIAGRLGIGLPLQRFDELGRNIPCIVNLRPSGEYLVHALHAAGGVPAVMKEIEASLDTDCLTVTGKTVGGNLEDVVCLDRRVIRPLSEPVAAEGALAVLWGNLVPSGAVIKTSAASPHLLRHEGRAITFENYGDMLARIDDPDLEVGPDSVLVLKNCGPKGVPGMPEWGAIPIPVKLQKAGTTDMVRISDGRMSGTSYGTVVLHSCPEAAAGGPLAIVENGDTIRLDVPQRTLELLLPDDEIAARLARWKPPATAHVRGYPRLYIDHVLQADQGCDFDFLRPKSSDEVEFVPPVVGRS